jgi:hypothetical protein
MESNLKLGYFGLSSTLSYISQLPLGTARIAKNRKNRYYHGKQRLSSLQVVVEISTGCTAAEIILGIYILPNH